MIKSLMACRVGNILQQSIKLSFAQLKPTSGSQKANSKLKPYQIMLKNNIENSIKFPSPEVFKLLRSRAITKIMAANHNIDETEQVLQAHIECIYALIHRIEPSIEAISMFTETVYGYLEELREPDIKHPALINLLKPTVMTKLVRISQSVEVFYNEAFRSLISMLIIRLLQKSTRNQLQHQRQLRKLSQIIKGVKDGSKKFNDEGNMITSQNLKIWSRSKMKEISQNFQFLDEVDYWNGFQLVLSMEYYTDEWLSENVIRLQKSLEKDLRSIKLAQLMIKIKAIIQLHRFKNVKEVSSRGLRVLFLAYNKMIQQYFKILSQQSSLLQIISSEQPIIQVQLLTTFLAQQHYDRAKKVYLDIFKAALNVSNNGVLLIDVNRLRGFFEVIITLYGHEDTKDIHALLTQLEKVMMMYPLERFEKLSAHCYVCDKFGFKSDFFAQKFYKYLLQQQEKLQRNRGHLHHVHQVTRQINLARNFLLYTKIGNKLPKEQFDAAQKIVSTLFDPNVWYLLTENDPFSQSFLLASSFSSYIYFTRTGIYNLTSNTQERRKIERTCSQMGLKNINRQHNQLLQDVKVASSRHTLKLDHHSNWKHNPYARMVNLLELANNHYFYLKRINPKDANNFIEQFLMKTLGSTVFYNTLRQRFAFPGVIQNFIELMQKANIKSFPIQSRDLEAIKRLYHAQLTKIIKESEKPIFVDYYQEHLEAIELNRVIIPYNQQIYGLPGLGNCASKSLLYDAMRRFEKQKEYFRIQIDTFLKFNKTVGVEVSVNYLELPHLADLLVTIEGQSTAILFRSYDGEPNHFLNYKQVKMQKEAEDYWRKKQFIVFVVKGQKDIQEFLKKITKKPPPAKK